MREVLIFAGTTEGRKLSERLAAAGVAHTLCVATEYGEIVLKDHPLVTVHRGRMNRKEMCAFIQAGDFAAVVDATHPYAQVVTENIKGAVADAMESTQLTLVYLRLEREIAAGESQEGVTCFENSEDCARALKNMKGNILLTTGSKELALYCASEDVKSRLYVRVLPGMESLALCAEQGIMGKQILALQGPFSVEMNEAMIRQYGIKCLVTKASGRTGGYEEKLEAARRVGIPVYVVGRGQKEDGDTCKEGEHFSEVKQYSFGEICRKLERICGVEIPLNQEFEITLAGIGMGSRDNLTGAVCQAIGQADILMGAERLIADYQPKLEKKAFYKGEQIIPYLKQAQETMRQSGVLPGAESAAVKVTILFSGDSGFYSGCQSLYRALAREVEEGRLKASLRILPGISSVAYLASCIGESYQDAVICSIHGKELPNLVSRIRTEKKLFLLMSGVKDVNRLGEMLLAAGLEACRVWVGYQLSYPRQQIRKLTPKECCEVAEEGLYICCIKNPNAVPATVTHGIRDAEFIRDKVPMTKEEVRQVSICKLRLHKRAVVYDIGSGTGSIAIEMAGLSQDIQVYAIERKLDAVSLIEQNKQKFQLENITVVATEAPEGLDHLPTPTHAFIGGSGGRLKEILTALRNRNPGVRVVINAISMETICELKEVLNLFEIKDADIVQMQVSRAKEVGVYHLMQAENPVWICAFDMDK